MTHTLAKVLRRLSGNTFLIILATMIGLHVSFLIVMAQRNQTTQQDLFRDQISDQIIQAIDLVHTVPPRARMAAISNIRYPLIQSISLSSAPIYPLIIRTDALWKLEQKLPPTFQALALSYQLDAHDWLNFKTTLPDAGSHWYFVMILAEIVVASTLLFAAWSIQRFTEPLKRFRAVALRLGVSFRPEKLEEYGPSIVKETAFAMNQMQTKIQELLDNRTKMLAAISHDLRTPITRLKLRTQFIRDEVQAEKANHDLNEMENMIAQILAYAKIQIQDEPFVKLELHTLLSTICNEYLDLGRAVSYEASDKPIVISGQSLALKRAFNNLITNALKYGTQANIQLKQQTDSATIIVSDNGPGIPEAEHEKVLQPFYRTDKARSNKTGGSGLGLAITNDIILAHQGDLYLQNLVSGGLSVTIHLPITPPVLRD